MNVSENSFVVGLTRVDIFVKYFVYLFLVDRLCPAWSPARRVSFGGRHHAGPKRTGPDRTGENAKNKKKFLKNRTRYRGNLGPPHEDRVGGETRTVRRGPRVHGGLF